MDARHAVRAPGLSLFWRTFMWLALLLLVSMAVWLQTFRSLELAPRATQTAQQLASMVNLSRAALIHADAIARISLIRTMSDEEGLQIIPREPEDAIESVDHDPLLRDIAAHLRQLLGANTVMASKVNGEDGLWIGFEIDGDAYWLLSDGGRVQPYTGRAWTAWLIAATALSLLGAAVIAGFVNQPLQRLSIAAAKVREGDFSASLLDETVRTTEIRGVNAGFNRMAQRLAQIDQDRAVMLAGISHDLRTPLARLRLEAEMSVADPDARDNMAADIAQVDDIIEKFLDYARPQPAAAAIIDLADVLRTCLAPLDHQSDVRLALTTPAADLLWVWGDRVELIRAFNNLLENARKYGRVVGEAKAQIEVHVQLQSDRVQVLIRDHGPGVPAEQLALITQPFYRGEAARTAANGSGLGLAIVVKTLQRMGADLVLTNAPDHGLQAQVTLRRVLTAPTAPPPPSPP